MARIAWCWVLAGMCCPALASAACPTERLAGNWGPWVVLESANFRVCGIAPQADLERLAATCEANRDKLAEQWLGAKPAANWQPKCHVVLHPTAASYLREVGQGQMTAGSSLIEFRGQQLVTRRVDLRADHPQGYADALAHELTHVVVAERFTGRQIPRWADEGMAVLADSSTKQSLHLADLDHARRRRSAFRVVELVNLEQYPAREQQGTFYGQSASLVNFLVARGGSTRFLEFVERATSVGYDRALRESYGIGSVNELELEWIAALDRPATMQLADARELSPRSVVRARKLAD